MQKIRVFLLDDHAIVRAGLRSLLDAEEDITVVGEAGTLHDGLLGILGSRPDVALLDARLPDGCGSDVARRLRDHAPEVRSLVLSTFDDEDTLVAAFSAGVSGYVLKEIDSSALLHAVREVAAGRSLVGPSTLNRIMARMRREDVAPRPAPHELLTPQEMRVLELIRDGLTNRQIGDRLFLSEKTIKNKVTVLMQKLGVERRTQAAVLAAQLNA